MTKIYEEYFSPVIDGGTCKVYLNNEYLDEFSVPMPDYRAERESDSAVFEQEYFSDGSINYEIEFISSRGQLIVSISAIDQIEKYKNEEKFFRVDIVHRYDELDTEGFNASYGMYAPPAEIPDFFSIRLSRSENIVELLELYSQKNTVSDLSIPLLTHYYKNLKIGSLVFIVAGGDKSVNRLDYKQGLYGIAVVAQEPYDLVDKKYTIDVRFIYFYEKVLSPDDLYPFENTKNIPYIGASTKGVKNQAISLITGMQASSVISASLSLKAINLISVRKLLPWFYSKILGNQKKATVIYDDFPSALNVDLLAKVFSQYIHNFRVKDSSTMIGIFGEWGRGKTFFYKKVNDILEKNSDDKKKYYFCVFQPWKYQEKESAWAYLYQSILDTYIKDGNIPVKTICKCESWFCSNIFFKWQNKAEKILHLNMQRNGKTTLLLFISVFLLFLGVVSALTSNSNYLKSVHFAEVLGLTGLMGIIGYMSKEFLLKSFAGTAKTANYILNAYGKIHSYKNKLGFQNEIEEEIKVLIKTVIPDEENNKLIIFVDDLDRCNEKMIINVIDSLRLILEDSDIRKKIIIISAIDERILKKAVEHKYETKDNKEIETYIEKFFLFGVRLGRLNDENIEELINLYSASINERIEDTENKQLDESESANNTESDTSEYQREKINQRNNRNTQNNSLSNQREEKEENSVEEKILNHEELQYIIEKMKSFNDLTPRKINIFIQRYLFFKALAMELLPKHIFESIDSRIYIGLVLNKDTSSFENMYANYKSTLGERMEITIDGYTEEVSKTDFLKLLSIAETVAPYSLYRNADKV